MSAPVLTEPSPLPPGVGPRLTGSRRKVGDRAFGAAALVSGLSVLVILLLIAASIVSEAWPAFQAEGIGFVTGSRWAPSADVYGAVAFIAGTLIVSAIALCFAVPISVGIALFLSELAPRRLRKPVIYLIDLLAAIPSVVFGLWGLVVLAPRIGHVYDTVAGWVESVPVLNAIFGPPTSGRSFMTAGLILALMITPIITSLTREVFDTVPSGQKEGAFALGATRWEMIRGAIFPHSRAGVTGAVMLGLGRAMGETIAAALVIGSSAQLTAHVFGPGDALAAVIANQFGEAGGLHRSALIGLGVVLFGMTIAVNIFARAVLVRSPAGKSRKAR